METSAGGVGLAEKKPAGTAQLASGSLPSAGTKPTCSKGQNVSETSGNMVTPSVPRDAPYYCEFCKSSLLNFAPKFATKHVEECCKKAGSKGNAKPIPTLEAKAKAEEKAAPKVAPMKTEHVEPMPNGPQQTKDKPENSPTKIPSEKVTRTVEKAEPVEKKVKSDKIEKSEKVKPENKKSDDSGWTTAKAKGKLAEPSPEAANVSTKTETPKQKKQEPVAKPKKEEEDKPAPMEIDTAPIQSKSKKQKQKKSKEQDKEKEVLDNLAIPATAETSGSNEGDSKEGDEKPTLSSRKERQDKMKKIREKKVQREQETEYWKQRQSKLHVERRLRNGEIVQLLKEAEDVRASTTAASSEHSADIAHGIKQEISILAKCLAITRVLNEYDAQAECCLRLGDAYHRLAEAVDDNRLQFYAKSYSFFDAHLNYATDVHRPAKELLQFAFDAGNRFCVLHATTHYAINMYSRALSYADRLPTAEMRQYWRVQAFAALAQTPTHAQQQLQYAMMSWREAEEALLPEQSFPLLLLVGDKAANLSRFRLAAEFWQRYHDAIPTVLPPSVQSITLYTTCKRLVDAYRAIKDWTKMLSSAEECLQRAEEHFNAMAASESAEPKPKREKRGATSTESEEDDDENDLESIVVSQQATKDHVLHEGRVILARSKMLVLMHAPELLPSASHETVMKELMQPHFEFFSSVAAAVGSNPVISGAVEGSKEDGTPTTEASEATTTTTVAAATTTPSQPATTTSTSTPSGLQLVDPKAGAEDRAMQLMNWRRLLCEYATAYLNGRMLETKGSVESVLPVLQDIDSRGMLAAFGRSLPSMKSWLEEWTEARFVAESIQPCADAEVTSTATTTTSTSAAAEAEAGCSCSGHKEE